MKNIIPADFAKALPGIRTELQDLLEALPMYGSWQIPELQRIAQRYSEILTTLVVTQRPHLINDGLIRTNLEIQVCIRDTVESRHWQSYNNAALALQFDLAALIELLQD